MKKDNKLKRFFKTVKPFIRGTLKALPFGSAIVEISDNIKAERELAKNGVPSKARIEGSGLNQSFKPPHNYISILIQLIVAFVIVYAFITKQITVNEVIKFTRLFLSFGNDPPSDHITTNLIDTIQ